MHLRASLNGHGLENVELFWMMSIDIACLIRRASEP